MQRWHIDGMVECYDKDHLPLAILAIIVLIFCAMVIILMAAVVKQKIKVVTAVYAYVATNYMYKINYDLYAKAIIIRDYAISKHNVIAH